MTTAHASFIGALQHVEPVRFALESLQAAEQMRCAERVVHFRGRACMAVDGRRPVYEDRVTSRYEMCGDLIAKSEQVVPSQIESDLAHRRQIEHGARILARQNGLRKTNVGVPGAILASACQGIGGNVYR